MNCCLAEVGNAIVYVLLGMRTSIRILWVLQLIYEERHCLRLAFDAMLVFHFQWVLEYFYRKPPQQVISMFGSMIFEL